MIGTGIAICAVLLMSILNRNPITDSRLGCESHGIGDENNKSAHKCSVGFISQLDLGHPGLSGSFSS